MNLRQYVLMPPDDEIAWMEFLSANEQSHQTIAAGIERTGKTANRMTMTGDPRNDLNWMSDHNQMHQSEGQALGLTLPDLSDYNLKDHTQLAEWMYLHAAVHAAENDVLGIY